VADAAAHQRGPDGRDARDPALAAVRLGRPDHLEDRLLAVFVELHPRPDLHPGPALGGSDPPGVLQLGLERLDPSLEEALLLASGVVLRILLEVSVFARRRDPLD